MGEGDEGRAPGAAARGGARGACEAIDALDAPAIEAALGARRRARPGVKPQAALPADPRRDHGHHGLARDLRVARRARPRAVAGADRAALDAPAARARASRTRNESGRRRDSSACTSSPSVLAAVRRLLRGPHGLRAPRLASGGVELKLAPERLRTDRRRPIPDARSICTRARTPRSRACYRACAGAWPPALLQRTGRGRAMASARIWSGPPARRAGEPTAHIRGSLALSLRGRHGPGVVNCQAAYDYGSGWFVVGKNGTAILLGPGAVLRQVGGFP